MKWPSILAIGLALAATHAQAYEGQGKNPGDWKEMPASLEQKADDWQLRLRNLDVFAKFCSLKLRYQGEVLVDQSRLLIKADRSIELPLGLPASTAAEWHNLETSMACVKLEDGETSDKVPDPGSLQCDLAKADCGHICAADAGHIDRCANDHLLIDFKRSTYEVEESPEAWTAVAQFVSVAKQDLICQLVITAAITGPAGDLSYIVAPSETVILQAGKAQNLHWNFSKTEAGEGRQVDLSRPRVAGLCSFDLTKKPADWYRSCQPLKRSECNWVVAR